MPIRRPCIVARVNGYGRSFQFAVAQVPLGLRQLTSRHQQQPEGRVRDLVVQYARSVRHHHPALGRGRRIDPVVPDPEARHELHRRQLVEERAVDRVPAVATARMSFARAASTASGSSASQSRITSKCSAAPASTDAFIGPGISTVGRGIAILPG